MNEFSLLIMYITEIYIDHIVFHHGQLHVETNHVNLINTLLGCFMDFLIVLLILLLIII